MGILVAQLRTNGLNQKKKDLNNFFVVENVIVKVNFKENVEIVLFPLMINTACIYEVYRVVQRGTE
jgi:hypothetical protein